MIFAAEKLESKQGGLRINNFLKDAKVNTSVKYIASIGDEAKKSRPIEVFAYAGQSSRGKDI